MIKPNDAFVLAFTKLRTRKVRLAITVIVSGLLFCALTSASFVVRGSIQSIKSFNNDGLGSKFLTLAYPHYTSDDPAVEQSVVARAKEIRTEIIAKKQKEAKRLGIEYDPKSEPEIGTFKDENNIEGVDAYSSPAAFQAVKEYKAKNPGPGKPEIEAIAKPYNPVGLYEMRLLNLEGLQTDLSGEPGNITVLADGKENYEKPKRNLDNYNARGLDSFVNSWAVTDPEILEPFVLKGASLDVVPGQPIPVLPPYTAAEELLGLEPLTNSAKPEERIERIKHVRKKISNVTFQACYRNGASVQSIVAVTSQNAEIKKGKKERGYIPPARQFAYPKKPCGSVQTTKDTRTALEKKAEDAQAEFDRIFGAEQPKSQLLTFQVVGLLPDPPDYTAADADQLITTLLGSTFGDTTGWLSPIATTDDAFVGSLFQSSTDNFIAPTTYITEFSTAETAKKFIKKEHCEPGFDGTTGAPADNCEKAKKPFAVLPFGSSSIALDEVGKQFSKYFTYAALVVAAIAAIIMMGTIGRIIADSRRETAVFRAIGAKRFDIAQIYLTYVLMLSTLISSFALIVGASVALFVHSKWSEDLTVKMYLIYNSSDFTKTFSLLGIGVTDILMLVGLIYAAGIVSAYFPLTFNIRRNPIRDMRDEN